ncbi:MAG: hypothetical protein PHQ46_11285 [Negativicutes bacterium]|nr:hypothetical protein [Negativicutes bacterium]
MPVASQTLQTAEARQGWMDIDGMGHFVGGKNGSYEDEQTRGLFNFAKSVEEQEEEVLIKLADIIC